MMTRVAWLAAWRSWVAAAVDSAAALRRWMPAVVVSAAALRRWLPAVVVSAASLLLLGWLSRAPYTSPHADEGLLRLSWRHRAERAEVCRPRTQAELDALPVHMRTPEICEGRRIGYMLVLRVDAGVPDTAHILPEGARQDRPVYVFTERRLAPGPHQVEVLFTAEGGEGGTLTWEGTLLARPGAIELITTRPDGKALMLAERAPGSRAP